VGRFLLLIALIFCLIEKNCGQNYKEAQLIYSIGLIPYSFHNVKEINANLTTFNMGLNFSIMVPYNEKRKTFIALSAYYLTTQAFYKLPISKNVIGYKVGILTNRTLKKKIYLPISVEYTNINIQPDRFTTFRNYQGIGHSTGIGYKFRNKAVCVSNSRNYILDFKEFKIIGSGSLFTLTYLYGL